MQHCRPEVYEEGRAKAEASQRKAKLAAVEALLWDQKLGSGKPWKLRSFFKRHFAFQIVRCLDVRLRDISLHVTIDRGLKLGVESPGITPRAQSLKIAPGTVSQREMEILKIEVAWPCCICCSAAFHKRMNVMLATGLHAASA